MPGLAYSEQGFPTSGTAEGGSDTLYTGFSLF